MHEWNCNVTFKSQGSNWLFATLSRKANKGLQNTARLFWLNAALQVIATTPLHMLLKGTKCIAEILSLK